MQQMLHMESTSAELKLKDKSFTDFGRMQTTLVQKFTLYVCFFLIWIANVVEIESKMLTYADKWILFRATKRLINANMHTTSETWKNRMQSKQNWSD